MGVLATPGLAAAVATAAANANVVESFYSDPAPLQIDKVHERWALACWQAGSKTQAMAAADAGCDFIIVQGIEAGGSHPRTY